MLLAELRRGQQTWIKTRENISGTMEGGQEKQRAGGEHGKYHLQDTEGGQAKQMQETAWKTSRTPFHTTKENATGWGRGSKHTKHRKDGGVESIENMETHGRWNLRKCGKHRNSAKKGQT